MKSILSCLVALLTLTPEQAFADCLSDSEIDGALGAQIRAGAKILDTQALGDRPLCSGLTLAQAIQNIHAKAFPEEQERIEAQDTARSISERASAPDAPAVNEDAQTADQSAVDEDDDDDDLTMSDPADEPAATIADRPPHHATRRHKARKKKSGGATHGGANSAHRS